MCDSEYTVNNKSIAKGLCELIEICPQADTRKECSGNYFACSLYQEREELNEN